MSRVQSGLEPWATPTVFKSSIVFSDLQFSGLLDFDSWDAVIWFYGHTHLDLDGRNSGFIGSHLDYIGQLSRLDFSVYNVCLRKIISAVKFK